MELAYRLATEDTPLIKQIRDNVIVSITPALEPDGRDRYVDWYYRIHDDDTYELNQYSVPHIGGSIVRHDNNRDINFFADHHQAAGLLSRLASAHHA